MTHKMTWLLSFVLGLGLVSTGYGEVVVVGDFETGLDGFWGNNDFVIAQSDTAATLGTKSLQAEGPGGWQMGIYLNAKPYQATLGTPGAMITADITAFPADMTTNWMNVDMVINAQNNDDNGAQNNVGWQPLGQEGITLDGQPHTYTWVLPEALTSVIAGTDDTIAWFELIVVSNTDGASVAKYYVDNVLFSYPDPLVGEVIGDFETGNDGWWGGGEFTLTPGPTGATLNAQALQVEGPGAWQMGAYLNLKSLREAMGTPGAAISVDITAFDADMATTWMNMDLVINGQNNDDNGANNNVGWQPLGSQDVLRDGAPHTYMWEIPEDLTTVLAGVDDGIGWYELVVVSNLEGDSVTYYMDNVQLIRPVVETEKSTDLVIGNWEQDLDNWVVGGGAEDLFRYNDVNGVTLDEYSLDLFVREGGGWNQDILKLDVMAAELAEAFTDNTTISVDVTRLVADWPEDNIPRWNEVALIVNTGGDGWNAWINLGVTAGWNRNDGDKTLTATWDYGSRRPEMNNLEDFTYLELLFVANVDNEYTGSILFYLDNMKLSGAGGALDPQPVITATDVAIDKTLTWKTGLFAATHHLYFGTEMSKVFGASEDSHPDVTFALLDVNSFDPNELLAFKTKYYWRVDEVNDVNPDSPWRGEIWDFTTADFVAIDDFEGYTDVEPDRPFDTWVDGYGVDDNGALAGYINAPFLETIIVHSGAQSMPMGYNNVGAAVTRSEIHRVWAEPQNWTFDGFIPTAMELYTRGGALTTAGQLYLIIEDDAGVSSGKVTNTDSSIFSSEDWVKWFIPLDAIIDAGVNLATVKKMTIGVSDLAGEDEAWGTIFLDDLRIYPPATLALEPDHVVVPETSVAPTIDGVMDSVWDDVNATDCLITEMVQDNSVAPEDAADLSAQFKALFDDTYFYVFIAVQDSVIDTEFSDWQGDSVEIYFDGDYSHGDAYDGVNDNQIRISVDDVTLAGTDSSLPIDGSTFKVLLTDSGYNIEAAFPLDVLQIYPSEDPAPLFDSEGVQIPNSGVAPNNVIGFEVQIGDNDGGGGRQTIMRWHSNDDNSWQYPNLFGQARLVKTAGE